MKAEVAPGPSDCSTEQAGQHAHERPPEQPMACRHKDVDASQTPGPGTYTLPRLEGPNTADTRASPRYSVAGRRKHHGLAEDLAKTPGPAALPRVGPDVYKTRGPTYTAGTRAGLPGDRTLRPGPADDCLGKVTLTEPRAPAPTFGLRHSLSTAALGPAPRALPPPTPLTASLCFGFRPQLRLPLPTLSLTFAAAACPAGSVSAALLAWFRLL
ncbi:ciliary microtubule associated protein 1A [Alca torda]